MDESKSVSDIDLEDISKRKERALEKIDNSERSSERSEGDTASGHLKSEGAQMRLDEYMSVKGNLEDKSTPSENLRGNLRVESKVTQSETDHPPERVSESTELAKDTREIDSELERALDEFGTRKVKMYSPEFRGREVSSEEELQNVIDRDIPGIKEHRNYEKMMEQAVNHFKAEERFGHRKMVSSGELVKFSEEINEPERTVRSWVVEGASPLMYPTLESAMTKQEAEEKIGKVREKLQGVDSYEKLQERLDHPYHETHTKTQVSYPKDLESTRKYYDFLDEMAKGGTIADVSRRVGFTQANGSRYLEGRIARLINRAIEPVPDFEPVEVREKYRIDSPEKYERALQRHPFVRDMPDFQKFDHEARVYAKLMSLKNEGNLPGKMVKDLAKENNVEKQQLASWLSERKTQELITRLEIYDEARDAHEAKLAKVAFEHRIDSSKVYEQFRHLRDVKEPTTNQLVHAIENMYRTSELTTRVQWGELRPYHSGGPGWMREIAKSIHDQREDVEATLNKRLGLDADPNERLRLGVLDSRLYIRREDTSEWNWMNIYKNEAFHFQSLEQKNQLVNETKARLGVSGAKKLSDLVDQMTEYQRVRVDGHPNYDLGSKTPYLKGETLNLSLDTTEKSIQDIQSKIERIGQARDGIGGISKPQFSASEKEIKSMFTSVLGAGLSDGHIELSRDGFVYTESNRDRVDIVNKQIDRFGDVYRNEDLRPNGVIRTRYSSAYGRALERRGLTKGDKSIQNEGFPDWLKEATPEMLRDYFGPMWAQDGNFYIDPEGCARFQVDRAVVLRDPSKEAKYEHQPLAKKEHADLVHKFGTPKECGDFKGLHELSFGGLKELKFHNDEEIAQTARSLEEIVEYTKSELLQDEREGLASMGVMTTSYIARLTYSEISGRLSVLYHVSTATKDDAMRVSFLCPPEDVRKLSDVRDWMKSDDVRRERVKNQLEAEGLLKGDEQDEF